MPIQKPDRRTASIQALWPEVEKMVAGLNDGMLEAYEMFGMALATSMDTIEQADLYMAVVFELLPLDVQEKLLDDPRLKESVTILPYLKKLRSS